MSANLAKIHPASIEAVSRPAHRAWIASLVIVAVVGVGLGAVLGGLAIREQSSEATASSLVRISLPADLGAVASGATDTRSVANVDSYVSGEVAYLSGPGFARQVGEKLGQAESAGVTVVQNGTSSVLTITGTAASGEVATLTVDAAIDVYRQQLGQRMDDQLLTVLPRLDSWERAAVESNDIARAQEVRNLREVVQLQAAQSEALEVVQPATVDDAAGNHWAIGALFGGLLGGLLAVVGLAAFRNRSHRLRSAAEVADVVDGLIVPAVKPMRHTKRSDRRTALLARTLYAQCPGSAPRRTIVVVGSSRRSGTAAVAALLERAAAEHGRVKCAELTKGAVVIRPEGDVEDENTLIVDAGALGESVMTAEAIAAATDLVVVARLNVDTVAQVLAVRFASASSPLPLMAAFTYRAWWRPGFSGKAQTTYECASTTAGTARSDAHESLRADVSAR